MEIENNSYQWIIENLHEGLYLVDQDKIITYWNKAAEKISGFSADEVIGKSCSDNILTYVDSKKAKHTFTMCPDNAPSTKGRQSNMIVYMHHKEGHRVPVSVRFNTITDGEGNIIGGIELFRDVSDQTTIETRIKELERLALLDTLTQLANRNYIEREIHNRFEEQKRFKVPFGILFMDIDHFKKFNDTYGHDVGDEVLKSVANTFVANCRPFDFYGRWGGEEFIGIIRNVDGNSLTKLGNRVRENVANSGIHHGNKKLRVTISIGATLVSAEDTLDSLIKRADKLLYRSKAGGRDCLTFG